MVPTSRPRSIGGPGSNGSDGPALTIAAGTHPAHDAQDAVLPDQLALEIHRIMIRARLMEERMIKMSKSGEGYFWIGGPGEEAFNICLGLQVKKGEGPDYDYLHLKYRAAAVTLAMGLPMLDSIRQMAMTATDEHSKGRNFPAHYSKKSWNLIPVTPVIGVQFAVAPGTALVQKRHGGDGVTIVVGGESGTAEGDFATCMNWATRPGQELPLLMIVMNNGFGISTPMSAVQSCEHVIDRGKPFGIPGEVVDGNDPTACWFAIERAFHYIRTERRPYMIEAKVSRLYGHSSSSGSPRSNDRDCLVEFETKLTAAGLLTSDAIKKLRDAAKSEAEAAVAQAMREPKPTADDVNEFTYAPSPVDIVYPNDFTGLPS
ncbi:MAG TPA: thiamine pyrophosphate-dependent dehydrogenase E1 component subunit alpha [Gemmataceae bacterium]|nr:thiamine pyrophosphate-dependent dehydrogenase E1 component subunit alpha [Gemmataceae bacterium]